MEPEPVQNRSQNLPNSVEERCPHSHLPIAVLKKIGKAVEKVGEGAVTVALEATLGNLGAFQDQ